MKRMFAKALALLVALAAILAAVASAQASARAAVPATGAEGTVATAKAIREDVSCDPTAPDYAGMEVCGDPGTGGGTRCSISSFDVTWESLADESLQSIR